MSDRNIKNFYNTYLKPNDPMEWFILGMLIFSSLGALTLLFYLYTTLQ